MKILTAMVVGVLINAAALWIAIEIMPRANFEGGFGDLVIVSLLFGLVNALVRPIARLLTFPLTLMTLGLFTIVLNGAMLLITAALTDNLEFDGGFLARLGAASVVALIVSLVSITLTKVLLDRD